MIVFEKFSRELFDAFTQPLPGKPAQAPLKPYLKINKHLDAPVLPNSKIGAVMSLIYPVNDIPHLLVIERTSYDGVHSGQLAFPGGKMEQSDKTFLDTALRETQEEVGIHPQDIQIIGPLTEVYVLASNFMVHPYVGILQQAPLLLPDSKEVANTLEIPLSTFFVPDILKVKPMKSAMGMTLMAPYYDIEGRTLWGATAMMISELCTVIRQRNVIV